MRRPLFGTVREGVMSSRTLHASHLSRAGSRPGHRSKGSQIRRTPLKAVATADTAVLDRALDLAHASFDEQQLPMPEEIHCPDAVVGVLTALEELGQPGESRDLCF